MEEWFSKAPALPTNIREVLVKITPFVAIIFGILGILGAISGLGLLTFFAPMAVVGGVRETSSYGMGFIATLFWLASSVLLLAAFPGTKNKQFVGWKLLFWSELVSLVGAIVSFSILSGLIGALIGFYLIFQIKSYYK